MKFKDAIKDLTIDLSLKLDQSAPLYKEEVIYQWLKDHFEEFHVKQSVTVELLEHIKNDNSYIKHLDKYALYKLLSDNHHTKFVFETELDFPKGGYNQILNPNIKEKTYSFLALKTRNKT